jgi:hypothetical protein
MSEVRRYLFDARAGTLSRYEDGAKMLLSADGELVPSADYDALAAQLDECIANCADPNDKRRIRELEAVLRLIADAKDVRGCGEIARKVLAGATGFVVSDGRTVKFNEATPDRKGEPT